MLRFLAVLLLVTLTGTCYAEDLSQRPPDEQCPIPMCAPVDCLAPGTLMRIMRDEKGCEMCPVCTDSEGRIIPTTPRFLAPVTAVECPVLRCPAPPGSCPEGTILKKAILHNGCEGCYICDQLPSQE
eukprot:TRINITY_DN1376_c0_g1::TRINITY_DN1376_c0_g1_i1::g.19947::m.19947 TRINITY_DN1376_c0_g1::TRINITY_DN1376_c0_g1_i1::g.19947  ORF type:complete len:127 (-),score=9.42,DUF4576/PF15144.1/0.096,DUF4576/PF15144.1/5.7e+03 TRINITY_DN1376_c0_g1_i1:167-547(-)